MRTVREKVIEQIRLQEKMQSLSKVNIVTCGNCGTTLLHDMNKDKIDCFACGDMLDQSDCPDYWYSGLENSEEYNREEMTPYKESQRVNSEIDAWASALDIEVNEPIELSTIIKQETLEGAALKYASEKLDRLIIPYKELNANVAEYVGFINGAKWQQERMYSEEDMIEFSKWRVIYEDANPSNVKHSKKLLQMWFEKFKKK